MKYPLIAFVCIFTLVISCKSKPLSKENPHNKYGRSYAKKATGFVGKLNNTQLDSVRISLSQNLNVNIEKKQIILLHYRQAANFCISYGMTEKFIQNFINNTQNISERFTKNHNTKTLFVYTKDYYFEKYLSNTNWILDNGFVQNSIFPDNEICSGFILIKTNGEFYKYYGEDYFSIIKRLLNTEN
ncbi:hypothetical protein [uncultured Winogradskyella sp.]|uniref:hypothetical protein n=1 Tax=uncultured Winogradskyella sp. TaxID=395353 RepID=UPI0030D796AD|tara:strand:+ start:1145 stop:1702 length:558 start_codon:yes stop_codon:yes gene_type:complete